ncbi:2-C-methyl-D-erythritol 4-phosphate cytidylyltransferase [Dysgonomonadaceae bacterium PH5-43]|nr:2-C-methyl-D-erythritol 4-phosphate cytidylyltransferase [Dysgonomonadaceae bacterium PH5-43]
MKNIAVILAGGSGSRMEEAIPKQFLKVAGKKVIEHTIDVFEQNENIDDIIIVSKADYIPEVEQLIINNQYTKVRKVLQGGKERYHSSLAAINAGENDEDNLIFHDAVRPLVNNRIINDCIESLKRYDVVNVAIKTTDTIIQVDDNNLITSIPQRSALRNGQTPQCFKRSIIKKAYETALKDPNFVTTDDCGVVKKYLPEVPIFVVDGEVFNMKLTYREDLFLLDKLFQLKSISDNKSLDNNAAKAMQNKVLVVFGGSYGIGEEVVKLGEQLGAKVYSLSRSQNNIDVCDEQCVHNALAEIAKENGHIDYVVCTAGLLVKEALYSMSYKKIENGINVNLLGAINVAKESYPYLKESKGSLLLYTSSSYTRGRMLYSIYSSTKAAIVNLVQALSEEWFSFGIRINCINPERTKTPMRTKSFGNEPEDSLLKPELVAIASVNTLTSKLTGEVVDVRR